MTKNKLHICLVPMAEADPFLGPQLGYDVQVLAAEATIGDYLAELEAFQAETLADCKGCDGCCQERAPLTFYDLSLAHTAPAELAHWLAAWGEPGFFGPALDIRLRRLTEGPAQGCCQFLDSRERCCRIHERRSFTCRTHCCLPKSERAEELRAALINAGEDELIRRLLALPEAERPWPEQLAACQIADYPASALSGIGFDAWPGVRLLDMLNKELWQKLCQNQT